MAIHPVQELSFAQIRRIKEQVKWELLNRAMHSYKGTGPEDWYLRETVFGDSTVTDFYDLDYLNAQTAGFPNLAFDAASLTADDLSSILAAGEEIPDETYIGFYGFVDIGVECGELSGAADTPPNNGAIVSARFKRGSSTLDFWQLEKLYGYPSVVGFCDRPVVYEKTQTIDLEVCSTEATEDKFAGFRGYTCERAGEAMRPFFDPSNPIAGGIDPIAELSVADIASRKQRTINELYNMAKKAGKYSTLSEVRRNMVIREPVAGDESDASDFVDLDQSATAQTTGQQNWAQDSSALTAGDLKNVLVAGEEVKDGKFIGIYGFYDKTANPCAMALAFEDGAGRKDFWQVEHVYAYRNVAPEGLTERPIFFTQNKPIKFMLNPKVARDNFIGLRAFILEDWGQVISEK